MAGKGPSGQLAPLAVPTVLPTKHEKCPKSPGKRKYYNLVDAEKAAAFSAQQYGKPMSAYVCDGCGLYHVTGKIGYGDVTTSRADGTIVTAGMSTRKAWKNLAPNPPERADMSEVIAMESPLVAGNTAARDKLVADWLEGRESITVPEVMEGMRLSKYAVQQSLRSLGWQGVRGRSDWLPPGVERTTLKKTKPGKTVRGNTSSAAVRKQRLRKLRAYLVDKEAVTSAEVIELLGAGKDQAKALLKEAGWNPGWGANAKWTPGEDKLAHRRRIVPNEAELEKRVEPPVVKERALHAVEPYTDSSEAIAEAKQRHPAGTEAPAEVAPVVDESDLGWRTIETNETVSRQTVAAMNETLAPFGFEVRIQVRERRG